jgi:hypothetical protein
MKITLGKLKELIHEAFGTRTTYIPTGEDIAKKKSDLKYGAKPDEWRERSTALFDMEVEELSMTPEFKTIESFIQMKMDDEEDTFSTLELRALVTSLSRQSPSGASQEAIKKELLAYLDFAPREPVKHARGFGSPTHGSNRHAGNAAGSGIEQGGLIGMGGGQGAIGGGGQKWDATSSRNLPMGSRRR